MVELRPSETLVQTNRGILGTCGNQYCTGEITLNKINASQLHNKSVEVIGTWLIARKRKGVFHRQKLALEYKRLP